MTKYSVPDDHWSESSPEQPPAWHEDTSADIEIDVRLHREGYQQDRKWTVHCSDYTTRDDIDADVLAQYAVEHRNKGNYWREGELWDDATDFHHLPLRVRKRVASVLNRDLDAITPNEPRIHREDGTGLADEGGESA